jgi:transmembrane sensor
VDPAGALGWIEGRLSFRNTPLSEVVNQANRYSETKLLITDPSLVNIRLSGNFKAGENESIASAAELILPVKIVRNGNNIGLVPTKEMH